MQRIIVKDPSGKIIDDFIASDDVLNNVAESDVVKIEMSDLNPLIKNLENDKEDNAR